MKEYMSPSGERDAQECVGSPRLSALTEAEEEGWRGVAAAGAGLCGGSGLVGPGSSCVQP